MAGLGIDFCLLTPEFLQVKKNPQYEFSIFLTNNEHVFDDNLAPG